MIDFPPPPHPRGGTGHTGLRVVTNALLLILLGGTFGFVAIQMWALGWWPTLNWMAMLSLATFAAVVVALVPIAREEQRRRRQAELMRFRLWIQFLKLRWLLTHLTDHDPSSRFFAPGVGGEELHGIEVMLAQAHVLEVEVYDWVIFTVNAALPHYGRPMREMSTHAPRLLWAVDATLAHLNREPSTSAPAPS